MGSEKPYVVIIGPLGYGKTSLTEKLTNKTGLGVSGFGGSATRKSTIFKTQSFEFADTPGYGSSSEKVDHAVNIVSALQHKPLSRIFIVAKYECRPDMIAKNVKDITRPLKNFRNLITIIVTHWDLAQSNSKEVVAAIKDEVRKTLGVQSVILSGKHTSATDLECEMKETLGTPVKFQIDATLLFRYFDLQANDCDMMDFIYEKSDEYIKLKSSIERQLNSMAAGQEQEDFMFSALAALSGIMEQFKDEFIEKFLPNAQMPEEFAGLDQLTSQLWNTFKEFRMKTRMYIKDYYTNSSTAESPFRKCPHCREVWMKVEGCDGTTTCGARPTIKEGELKKKRWKWAINLEKVMFSEIEDNSESSAAAKPKSQPKVQGCGKSITWKDMIPIKIPEEVTAVPEWTWNVGRPKLENEVSAVLSEAMANVKINYSTE